VHGDNSSSFKKTAFKLYTMDVYKLIDNLFGKIAARLQMSLLANTRHMLRVPND